MSKNTIPKIGDQNATTGELIYREMNDDEFAQYEIDKANGIKYQAEEVAKEAAKLAILDRIGLTADELKTILG
jgi:hypothetical protein